MFLSHCLPRATMTTPSRCAGFPHHQALKELGYELEDLYEEEQDAGLGNGGSDGAQLLRRRLRVLVVRRADFILCVRALAG